MGWRTIKHWLGPRTFASIFVSGFSGWNVMTNMRLLMDDPIAVGTLLLFLAAGLITWWIIGDDNRKAEKRDFDIADMKSNLKDILDNPPKNMPPVPASLSNLSSASSLEIRSGVSDLVAKMREFEKVCHDERSAISLEDTENQSLIWQQQNSAFNSEYRPDALAYRDEMRRRVSHVVNEQESYKNVALDYGMLTGPNPIRDAVSGLEKLARQLP
jgi:hypothetical protein